MTFLIFEKLVEVAKIMYTEAMTKAEMIAKYGQQYYDVAQSRQKAKLREKRAAMTPEERTAAYAAKKDYVAQWRRDHPEQVAALARKAALAGYYRLSPEARKALALKRRAARKAKLAADSVLAAEQKAKSKARYDKHRAENAETFKATRRTYSKTHPEVERAKKLARRAAGKVPAAFVKFLCAQPCIDCGATDKKIEVGHLIPVVNGGTNNPLNLIAQCRSCNMKQHGRIHPRAMMVHYPEAALAAA